MSDRKTVSLSQEAYDALAAEKREGESFSDLALRLCEGSDHSHSGGSDTVELPVGVLTVDHLDDIAARTARQTADEVENRMARL